MDQLAHHYVEIQVVHMGSATLGFSHHACTRTKTGTQCDSTDALLAARGPGQFIAVDTVSKETSDTDGAVTSKLYLHAEGGVVLHQPAGHPHRAIRIWFQGHHRQQRSQREFQDPHRKGADLRG